MDALPSVSTLRSNLDRALGLRQGVQAELQQNNDKIISLEQEESTLTLVAELLRHFIDREVTLGVEAVQNLQTEGLQAVFDDQDLHAKAEVEVSRGKVSVNLVTVQTRADGEIEGEGMDAFGGALVTLQSVLLRIIIIVRRGLRPLLVMDESLPAIEGGYLLNMGRFLSVLCAKLGVDILVVTHNPLLVDTADRAYRISLKDEAAHFQLVKG